MKLRQFISLSLSTFKLDVARSHPLQAGSVDDKAVDTERLHVQDLMKKFAPRDRWNFDETSLFPK